MVSLQVPNAVQLRLIWSFDGQLAINVIGFTNTGLTPINQALADRVGSAIKTNMATNIGPHLATTTILEKVGVRDLNQGGQVEYLDGSAGVAGTGVGEALPRQTALVVTIRTPDATKSGRGRVYVGGYTEAENVAGEVASAAAMNTTEQFVGAVNAAMQSENMSLGVISRPANATSITTTETLPSGDEEVHTKHYAARAGKISGALSYHVRDAQWDTQRRRNNGRGSLTLSGILARRAVPIQNHP